MLFKRKKKLDAIPTGGPQYGVSVTITDNVVVGVIYEIRCGLKTEVARGHGHIIHAGAIGVVQATSYAFREAWRAVTFKKEDKK